MEVDKASRTAWRAAFHRAAHQILEQGRIFHDPLAVRILGQEEEWIARYARERSSGIGMRLFIAARTRFAEDSLAAAVSCGVTQLVVLGAGLDTFAYRAPAHSRLRIFEVDHPATQEWKRQRLTQAGIVIPDNLTFTPIDFERETLADGLARIGFVFSENTFFTWLGVVPYLTEDAVWSTLHCIAGFRNGAHVVFDYSDPPASFAPEMRAIHDRRAARVAAAGEPWVTYFDPPELHRRLHAAGFAEIEDLGPSQILQKYFPYRAGPAPATGGHVLRASTISFAG